MSATKPGGAHVFTTPIVSDRPTRQRARLKNGRLVHLLPPSHHGAPNGAADDFLVFYEFGADFLPRCERAGFEVAVLRHETNPALLTFTARRRA